MLFFKQYDLENKDFYKYNEKTRNNGRWMINKACSEDGDLLLAALRFNKLNIFFELHMEIKINYFQGNNYSIN
jgi:hypothetical protein